MLKNRYYQKTISIRYALPSLYISLTELLKSICIFYSLKSIGVIFWNQYGLSSDMHQETRMPLQLFTLNSNWPSGAICRLNFIYIGSGNGYLMAPSHCLTQYWLVVVRPCGMYWSTIQSKPPSYEFENHIFDITNIFPRGLEIISCLSQNSQPHQGFI